MRRYVRGALAAILAAGITLAASTALAAAKTSGSETFKGVLVVSGASGGRDVLASPVVMRGVFNGVGRIVEVENRPGDPDSVSRDDLVFAEGSIHFVNETVDASFALDPRSCIGTFRAQQATRVDGGTGRFAGATGSFAGEVNGRGLARRNPDGSCAADQAPLFEVDTVTGSGSLSF